jgi:hypothetical protein
MTSLWAIGPKQGSQLTPDWTETYGTQLIPSLYVIYSLAVLGMEPRASQWASALLLEPRPWPLVDILFARQHPINFPPKAGLELKILLPLLPK